MSESEETVRELGLKPLLPNVFTLGLVSGTNLNAEEYDKLHARVSVDLMKLVNRIKESQTKVCIILVDGNPVNPMVVALVATNRIPIQVLTTSGDTKENQGIWYVNDWKKSLLQSSSLVLNYDNEELSEYAEGDDIEDVEILTRPFRGSEKEYQNLQVEQDPYARYWTDVQNKLRITRMRYSGVRINQIIDLRPPKLS